jgi:hypothetical protein
LQDRNWCDGGGLELALVLLQKNSHRVGPNRWPKFTCKPLIGTCHEDTSGPSCTIWANPAVRPTCFIHGKLVYSRTCAHDSDAQECYLGPKTILWTDFVWRVIIPWALETVSPRRTFAHCCSESLSENPRKSPVRRAGHYMIQPLVELSEGCLVVLKVS